MKKFRTTVLLLCMFLLFCIPFNMDAQAEKVILYNSQPVKVELAENGKILSFIGLVPGYMEGYDLSVDPIFAAPEKTEETAEPPTEINAEYNVVSAEREELQYKANFATLDKSIINKLDEIAAKLKAEPNTKLLLTAHKASLESNRLTANRLSSAIAYLGLKGISADRIQSDIQKNETLHNIIAVNYFN